MMSTLLFLVAPQVAIIVTTWGPTRRNEVNDDDNSQTCVDMQDWQINITFEHEINQQYVNNGTKWQ